MSCITIPKAWNGSRPGVEITKTSATAQKRTTRKIRAAPQLVDTVREVVHAFELEYAQVRAESAELKTILDDRRTQLSDLRKHLEKESSENGILEAVVQHRSTKNDKGDARLASLNREFSHILDTDKVIESQAQAAESDLRVFTEECKWIREKVNSVVTQLDRAERALQQRKHSLETSEDENERLCKEVMEGRRAVEERHHLLRQKQQKALASKASAKELAGELKSLTIDMGNLTTEVACKEAESTRSAQELEAIERMASEARQFINEDETAHKLDLDAARARLADIKQQIATMEKTFADQKNRIQAIRQSNATESEAQAAKRVEIASIETKRKQEIQAQLSELSIEFDSADAEVTKAEEAVKDCSDRIAKANKDFSDLMLAMSSAFREYDRASTANRELERSVAEAERSLASLREANERKLSSLRETRDGLVKSIAEGKATSNDKMQEAREAQEALRDMNKSISDAVFRLETRKEKIAQSERSLEEQRTKQRADRERRVEALKATKAAEATTEEDLVAARTLLEKTQLELVELNRQKTHWEPPPVVLSESDLRRIDEEAEAAAKELHAGKADIHASRIRALKEALVKIQEEGAKRLQAEKDAAAARLAGLQTQVKDVTQSIAELRARRDTLKRMEENIAQEASRKAVQQRRIEDEKKAAAVVEAAEAAAEAAAAAAEDGEPIARPSISKGLSSGARSTECSHRTQASTKPAISDAVDTLQSPRSASTGRGAPCSNDNQAKEQKVEHGIGRTVHSANNRLDSAKRHKKSTRSSSQESRAHNQEHQIASESTAETAGIRDNASSTKKYTGNRSTSSASKYTKRGKSSSSRVASKSGSGAGLTLRSGLNEHEKERGRSKKCCKRSSKKSSTSPRPRPRSPRLENKEYDLWTDNKLLGDYDFTFF